MRKTLIVGDRKKGTKKSQVSSSESKDKKSTLIKTQSDLEKELEIPSYDEFKIKDNDSLMDYDDEDVETKMIRLVFLKKRGENIKDKINLKKKSISKKSDNFSKMQKIKMAVNLLEKLKFRRKKKILFKFLKAKKYTLQLKIAANFLNKIKKYIIKTYIKDVYNLAFPKIKNEKPRESLISKAKNRMIYSPQFSNKKVKKFKFPNKMLKLELLSKKSNTNQKGGVETILERVKKEKQKEKILGEKLRKLDNIRKREREYITRMNIKKKKIKQEIELYKKNNNISDNDDMSQIKQISDGGTIIFSNDNSGKLGSFHFDSSIKTDELSRITRKKKQQKTTKEIKLSQILKETKHDNYRNENESEIYSFNRKKLNTSENRNDNNFFLRNSVKNIRSNKKLDKANSKSLRKSMKPGEINFRNKLTKDINEPNSKKQEEKNNHLSNNILLLNDSENIFKEEENQKEEKSKTLIKTKEEEEDELDITDEEEGGEISDSNEEDFIQVPEDRNEY